MRETGLRRKAIAVSLLMGFALGFAPASATARQAATGPLRVHPTNPRYFANAQGHAVYLTGSHTWGAMHDLWTSNYAPFDWNGYLNMLQAENHNFIRLWRIELPEADYGNDPTEYSTPHPWPRTGPGTAGDGQPKFNLNVFNQDYFNRLRQRCIDAGNRGMYVGVMLFEGHGLNNTSAGWYSHPFKASNNVNGVNGDTNSNNRGEETHTLDLANVRSYQEAYVRKVIDTLNDLDNIIFEISNESPQESIEWQHHFVDYIKNYESAKPQQHLVWMSTTFPSNTGNSELWSSNADVISPGTAASNAAYRDNPPANSGSKIIINDTDHLWGCGGSGSWVWKSFTRGLHPIYMEGYYDNASFCPPNHDMREQMGATRSYALRMNLANAVPSASLANTGWCLADVNDSYVVYAPGGGSVSLNLSAASGTFDVEWFRPATNQTYAATATTGGGSRMFSPPFSGSAVLFVSKPDPEANMGDINGDGLVNVVDLLAIISGWGACAGCAADTNNDGVVNVTDLLAVVSNWG